METGEKGGYSTVNVMKQDRDRISSHCLGQVMYNLMVMNCLWNFSFTTLRLDWPGLKLEVSCGPLSPLCTALQTLEHNYDVDQTLLLFKSLNSLEIQRTLYKYAV